MFLMLPLILSLFQQTLRSAESYAQLRETLAQPLVKLVLIGLLWALLHHLFAGLRFLALDFHRGTSLPVARATARLCLAAGVILTAALGAWLW